MKNRFQRLKFSTYILREDKINLGNLTILKTPCITMFTSILGIFMKSRYSYAIYSITSYILELIVDLSIFPKSPTTCQKLPVAKNLKVMQTSSVSATAWFSINKLNIRLKINSNETIQILLVCDK